MLFLKYMVDKIDCQVASIHDTKMSKKIRKLEKKS